MRNVFIPEPLPLVRKLPMLADASAGDNRLFQHIAQTESPLSTPVSKPEEADFFFAPAPAYGFAHQPGVSEAK